MKTVIKFGTDGWRGIIAEDFTFDNVRVCAQSVALYLKRTGLAERGLVVGYDTRFASEQFAAAVAEVAAANGIPTLLCNGPHPTPVITYTILDQGAGGAVIITASHNPAAYNGFKYKPEYAGSASPEVVEQLERAIPQILERGDVPRMPLAEAEEQGLVRRHDPALAYTRHLDSLVDLSALRSAGIRVVADAMYGTGAGWFPSLLSGGKTQVIEVHGERNPLFPGMHNPEPIARNLSGLSETVRREGADVGIATDGDADRVGMVDEQGNFIDPLQTFGLLAYYLLAVRGQRGPIVKSITTTRMVNRLGEIYGVPVYETAVGFKFLGPKMMETDALIGGEESGGFGFRGHMPERDGVLSGLFLLDLMVKTGKRPTALIQELYDKVGPHHYGRVDIPMTEAQKPDVQRRAAAASPDRIAGLAVAGTDTTDGYRFDLEGGGWLLLRFSGTEPLLRIYTEVVGDKALVDKVLAAGREMIGV